jgi:hypothetical protein
MHDSQGNPGTNSARSSSGTLGISESSDRIHDTEQCEESNTVE